MKISKSVFQLSLVVITFIFLGGVIIRGTIRFKIATETDILRRYRFIIQSDWKEIKVRRITYYCPCEKCCGVFKRVKGERKLVHKDYVNGRVAVNIHYSTILRSGLGIIATDGKVIPRGSILLYKGKKYLACDSGGSITGSKIDIFVPPKRKETPDETHKRIYKTYTTKWNVRAVVFIPKKKDRWRFIQAFREGGE